MSNNSAYIEGWARYAEGLAEALRFEAEQTLGESFDLKEFDRVVLESGVVPLTELRRHVDA